MLVRGNIFTSEAVSLQHYTVVGPTSIRIGGCVHLTRGKKYQTRTYEGCSVMRRDASSQRIRKRRIENSSDKIDKIDKIFERRAELSLIVFIGSATVDTDFPSFFFSSLSPNYS